MIAPHFDLLARPRRIAIIGNAGGGKSMLARRLGAALDLPVRVVDDVQWLPGWQRAPLERVAAAHADWLAADGWVIDGWGGWDLIEARFRAADAVAFVDLPLARHYWWALRRHAKAIAGRPDGWPPTGCEAWPITAHLVRLMWRVHRELRPRLLELSGRAEFRPRVAHIRSVGAMRVFERDVASAPAPAASRTAPPPPIPKPR